MGSRPYSVGLHISTFSLKLTVILRVSNLLRQSRGSSEDIEFPIGFTADNIIADSTVQKNCRPDHHSRCCSQYWTYRESVLIGISTVCRWTLPVMWHDYNICLTLGNTSLFLNFYLLPAGRSLPWNSTANFVIWYIRNQRDFSNYVWAKFKRMTNIQTVILINNSIDDLIGLWKRRIRYRHQMSLSATQKNPKNV